jgi:hypothetical protein
MNRLYFILVTRLGMATERLADIIQPTRVLHRFVYPHRNDQDARIRELEQKIQRLERRVDSIRYER